MLYYVPWCFILFVVFFCRKHDQSAAASKRPKMSHVTEYEFYFSEFLFLACLFSHIFMQSFFCHQVFASGTAELLTLSNLLTFIT